MSKKKLLFLGPLPEPTTGHSLACRVLVDNLLKEYDVEIVDLNKRSLKSGAHSVSQIFDIFKNILKIAKGRVGSDIIYFTVSESFFGNLKDLAIYAVCLGKLSRTIIHLHGGAGMTQIMAGKYPLLAPINRFFLRRLAGVIVLGDRLKPIYASALPAERVHVAKNFAEDSLFVSEDCVRAKFAATSPLQLLFLSNLIPGKGHMELVSAFKRLPSDVRAGLRLNFAGKFEGDADEVAFRAMIADTPEITYRGVVRGAEKRDLLLKAHVFLLPTYYAYEGQPISILEAYAAGAAVVTTDHSGIFDTFTPGVNGYAVEKRSVEDLAETLSHIARNIDELGAIGLRNARDAWAYYRVDQHIAQVRRAMALAVPSA